MTSRKIDFIKNETRDTKWLMDKMSNDELFIDNTFQRKYVWLKKHQINLIETILLGYTIPEIYLWTISTDPNKGSTTLSIVDGQQRIGAVYEFINGGFKLEKANISEKDSSYSNKFFKELSDDQKSAIWEYPFSIRFIKQDVPKEDIISMFLRLNSTSNSLNPQELRNAEFNGEFLKLAEELSTNDFWIERNVFSQSQIRRMTDIQIISSLLIFLRFGIEEETTQSNINRIYDMFNETYIEKEEDRSTFSKVLKTIDTMVVNEEIEKFVQKTTHLYILFIIAYLMNVKKVTFIDELKNNLISFVANYEESPQNQQKAFGDLLPDILEYKRLSSEGTQSKNKRIRRLEIMRKVLKI